MRVKLDLIGAYKSRLYFGSVIQLAHETCFFLFARSHLPLTIRSSSCSFIRCPSSACPITFTISPLSPSPYRLFHPPNSKLWTILLLQLVLHTTPRTQCTPDRRILVDRTTSRRLQALLAVALVSSPSSPSLSLSVFIAGVHSPRDVIAVRVIAKVGIVQQMVTTTLNRSIPTHPKMARLCKGPLLSFLATSPGLSFLLHLPPTSREAHPRK